MRVPEAIERTWLKFLRDVAVATVVAVLWRVYAGETSPEVLLTVAGTAAYRAFRDIIPAIVSELHGE